MGRLGRSGQLGALGLLLLAAVAALAPVAFDPTRTQLDAVLRPPSAEHWLGTDELGRDVLARVVHGARVSLGVAALAVAVQVLLGVLVGGVSGLLGGWVDAVLSRLTEALLSVPAFLLVLGTLGLTRASSVLAVALVLGVTRWPDVARVVRAETQRAAVLPYVDASRALGVPPLRVLVIHVLPSALAPVQVAAVSGLGGAILAEAALSVLGYGPEPGTPSWGELLAQAHRHALYPGAWWLTLCPGLALFATVGCAHLVGEALRARADG